MKLALHAKNKHGFVNGTCSRPVVNSPILHQWERCNVVVLSWILSSVSKEIYSGLVYSTDASSVWADLKELFDKQLWDEYASLVVLPSCTCPTSRAYVEHDQHQRLLQFLMRLNESYGAVRSHILLMNPLPSMNQAYSLICQEKNYRSVISMPPIADAPATAFYSSASKQSDALKCDNCTLPGHTKDTCYRLIGYPSGYKLHKKFPQLKGSKVPQKALKISAHNSVSNASETPTPSIESNPTVIMFTPAQYEQILRLLESSNSPTEPIVNLAGTSAGMRNLQLCPPSTSSVCLPNGTLDWEDHGDW